MRNTFGVLNRYFQKLCYKEEFNFFLLEGSIHKSFFIENLTSHAEFRIKHNFSVLYSLVVTCSNIKFFIKDFEKWWSVGIQ